jgi:hypothetical protein
VTGVPLRRAPFPVDSGRSFRAVSGASAQFIENQDEIRSNLLELLRD